jgi:uncharacterized membrane protein
MRLLRFFLISVLVLSLLLFGIGLLMPSRVVVSRAIDLPVAATKVLPLLQNIQQWPRWMQGLDSSTIKQVNDSVYQLGNLRVNWITRTDSLMLSEWHSPKGTMQLSAMQLISIPQGQGCTVQWQFEQAVGWWPWERLGSMMNEKIMGPQLETNLQRLSNHLLTTP